EGPRRRVGLVSFLPSLLLRQERQSHQPEAPARGPSLLARAPSLALRVSVRNFLAGVIGRRRHPCGAKRASRAKTDSCNSGSDCAAFGSPARTAGRRETRRL